MLSPYDPEHQDLYNILSGFSSKHPLGTDELGRDEPSRLLFAARTDLQVGVLAILFPLCFGTLAGTVAGYYGGIADGIVSRVIDVVIAFPFYVLVIALVFVVGTGTRGIYVAFAVADWIVYARAVRATTLVVRESDYVAAARSGGLGDLRVRRDPGSGSTRARLPAPALGRHAQRVVIAIALASEPVVLLCDEPTTALDVTVQAQVLDLIDSLRARLHLTVVFVSHDLAVVRQLCDGIAVMYTGRLVETGPTTDVLERPRHPYTLGLLEALVDLDRPVGAIRPIPGALPNLEALPSGCPFHPRCAFATPECALERPPLFAIADEGGERASACIHHDRLVAA